MKPQLIGTLFYRLERRTKTYDVYQLEQHEGKQIFPEFIRFENFRGYSNGKGFERYLRIKDKSSWAKSKQITGVFPLVEPEYYYGDHRQNRTSKNLIIFRFSQANIIVRIDYYNGYFSPFDAIKKEGE